MKTTLSYSLLALAGVCLVLARPVAAATNNSSDRLVVHEWGTFTVLQNESGQAVPGVNINEESLPPFVHRLAKGLAPDSHELGPLLLLQPYQGKLTRSKGVPRFYPAVTMRMETPIIYFHPPASAKAPLDLDVEVHFHGGWISEWFPHAKNEAPGFNAGVSDNGAGHITRETVGRIAWKGLRVGDNTGALPQTKEHVWLAPRQVQAATVRNGDGETEKFLFYRGVANMEAPLRVVRESSAGDSFELRPNTQSTVSCGLTTPVSIRYLWLADIRPDGMTAFRDVAAINSADWAAGALPKVEASFAPSDYRAQNQAQLRAAMRAAVIASGLYADEADALLNTWQLSYFKSPGLRLFFVLPRAWTDAVLPLQISATADIERVMIGRIELVTPEQRDLLRQIARDPVADGRWFSRALEKLSAADHAVARRDLLAGKRSLADFGIEMPPHYRHYVALGRFRDALVMDELRRNATPALQAFVDAYGLGYFSAR